MAATNAKRKQLMKTTKAAALRSGLVIALPFYKSRAAYYPTFARITNQGVAPLRHSHVANS